MDASFAYHHWSIFVLEISKENTSAASALLQRMTTKLATYTARVKFRDVIYYPEDND